MLSTPARMRRRCIDAGGRSDQICLVLAALLLVSCVHSPDKEHVDPRASVAVPVASLPPATVGIARDHLAAMSSTLVADTSETMAEHAWRDARLADEAIRVFDPLYRGGTEPAYIEFKVVPNRPPATGPVPFLGDNELAPSADLGYILVSANESDSPVPAFNEGGSTPYERLLARVGAVPNVKIMRFGPTFATVEDESGALLANAGADPFRIPHDFVRHMDRSFVGEFDSESAKAPPENGWGGPPMKATHYPSYEAFKEDYLSNPVYREMAARRERAAAPEWAYLRGETLPEPEVLSAEVGKPIAGLSDRRVSRYFLDDDSSFDEPLATVTLSEAGGRLEIVGHRPGTATLTLQTPAGIRHFEINVGLLAPDPEPDPGFTPGWQPARIYSDAGGWAEQPRYWQISAGKWCPKVGCGPVAWAILFAWWDRRNVHGAFYEEIPADLTRVDAPFILDLNDDYNGYQHVKEVLDQLHDYCDVICETIGGAGASPPGDMVEAGPTYLWLPKIAGYLGYKYSWAWDLNDPDWNEPSNRIRTANKKGLPAIIGLGWMWHYGVSYAYRYQELKATADGPVIARRRWFRVNEGWPSFSPSWYSGGDTFLGAYVRAWNKSP